MTNAKDKDSSLLKTIATTAKDVTGRATSTLASAASAVAGAIPDAQALKHGMGRALILGGRTLIDPKAMVGELAVQMGQRLTGPSAVDEWLALAAADEGFVVLARGDEAAARSAMESAQAEGHSVILCKVLAAHTGRTR